MNLLVKLSQNDADFKYVKIALVFIVNLRFLFFIQYF